MDLLNSLNTQNALAEQPTKAPFLDALEAGGLAIDTFGALREGRNAAEVGKWRQGQFDAAANMELAGASREVAEARRQGRIAQSALQARTAGGGDPNLAAAIEAETEYSALSALYEGRTRAQALQVEGEAAAYSGAQGQRRARRRAVGGLLEAAPSMYEKYQGKLPEWMR